MHVPRTWTLAMLAIVLASACAERTQAPADPVIAGMAPVALTDGGEIELKRPKVDVTGWLDDTEDFDLTLIPQAPRNLGPGTPIIITIPNVGRFGCSANFVWKSGGKLYLGSAGHCFLPEELKSTHGAGADYDASGVVVEACVEGCEGNFRTARLVGKLVTLGRVAYARQTDPTGQEPVGNDFGVVEIPAHLEPLVRPEMPVWGGPKGTEQMEFGKFACHFGNGVVVGETFLTKARVGLGGGSEPDYWMGDFAGAFGDSGSGIVGCESTLVGFQGKGAIGVLTHLGIGIGDVKYKNLKMKAEHGVILGTTMKRAVEMGREAGLSLSLVQP
jgi:hypothetical protein